MPTARRILSGVASALFIARRIQVGLAANINPSSTNRMPTPMRKSANAMDLIGRKPPADSSYSSYSRKGEATVLPRPCQSDLCVTASASWFRCRRRRGRTRRLLARRAAEVAEEVGLRPQQEAGIAALQPVLIGRHRAVEREEIRILAVGLG